MRAASWDKTPPQPLPTRGRGYGAAASRNSLIVSARVSVAAFAHVCGWNDNGAASKPSPLWGG
ncbi:hypothetical protein GFM18_09935, partial [Rhizobium laguerreae]|nr:hypothetical protein [Rhizobium laguerreae]